MTKKMRTTRKSGCHQVRICLNFPCSEDDSDEEEDDTAELLRELEKIKRERAEEKARQVRVDFLNENCGSHASVKEREQSDSASQARDAEIATSNPLLNLQAALGQTPGGSSTGSFTVKRRWDDGEYCPFPRILSLILLLIRTIDLIFKNQATGTSDKPSGHFVNDLLRTEFHKYVANAIHSCSSDSTSVAGDLWLNLLK